MSKPVAWSNKKELSKITTKYDPLFAWKNKYFDNDIPLYTHPVKQLSDEEILNKVWAGNFDDHHCLGFTEDEFLNCVRAIIKEITE